MRPLTVTKKNFPKHGRKTYSRQLGKLVSHSPIGRGADAHLLLPLDSGKIDRWGERRGEGRRQWGGSAGRLIYSNLWTNFRGLAREAGPAFAFESRLVKPAPAPVFITRDVRVLKE